MTWIRKIHPLLCGVFLLALAGGCGAGKGKEEAAASAPEKEVPSFPVVSSAFGSGEAIPKEFGGEGEDHSPPLTWKDLPAGAKEVALICDDPDAPSPEPWVHWVAWGLAPDSGGLPAGIPESAPSLRQGKNDFGSCKYRGPMPPPGSGVHHYRFTVYALDANLELEPGAGKKELLQKMKGHMLAQGLLTGKYERK